MQERDHTIERLFHAALEREPAARAAFVAAECSDPMLASEVLALLGHHDDSGVDLEALPGKARLDSVAEDLGLERIPAEIGPYRIERTLGRGGFGVVYLAEQRSALRRKVALKVVRRGMDTDEVVRRFEAERQALALLDHPSIAKVYDAGVTDDGRPYFAMEYVPGATIDEHCDTQRVGTEDRLRLFVHVCDAVQHAHEKGILHRDLKPSNILVRLRAGAPTPVVIDFGLAKALHQPLIADGHVTREGAFVGTPEFASPEQIRSGGFDVDTRSDVYSLGAVLYYLLTGEVPIECSNALGGDLAAIYEGTHGSDPPAPSNRVASSAKSQEAARLRRTEPRALVRRLAGDLDLITLKALEKDRARRYASVSELAADVQRHLAHEPILAAPPELSYRLRKLLQRHRGALITASALLATLVLGLVGTTTGWRRASLQLELTRSAEERARAELQVSHAIQEYMTDVMGAANPWAHRGVPGLAREAKIVDALALAAARAGAAFKGLPAIDGAVRRTLGENYHALGLAEEAEAQLRLALELVRDARGDDDASTARVKMALATTLEGKGDFAESARLRESALAWLREHEPSAHVSILELERDLANLAKRTGRVAEAGPALREVLARSEALLGATHKVSRDCKFDLAALEFARHEPAEALRHLRELHETCVAQLGEDDAETIDVAVALGGALVQMEQAEAGEAMLVDALEDATRVFGERHPLTLGAINNLGLSYQRSNDLERAEPLLRRAVEIGSATNGPRHPNTLQARANLGLLQRHRGDFVGAEQNLRECWTATCEALGPRCLDSATYELYVAYVDHDLGRFDDAEAHFENVIDIRREALGDAHPETTLARNRLGTFLLGRGRLDEAEAVLTKALADGRARLPQGHYTVVQTYETLLKVREDQGRMDERAQLERDLAAWSATER